MQQIVVAATAGLLAGLGTGFAGLSAAVFIAPMLISFLGIDSFTAIGIALASDVLASGVSTITYHRHGNVDLRRNWPLMATVLVVTVMGSIASHAFTGMREGELVMSWWLPVSTLGLGVKLALFPAKEGEGEKRPFLPLPPTATMVACGAYIGFVCGFQGAGGGLMLLFVLSVLLGNEFKRSVGTSVCIMTFTALIGATSHFLMRGVPDLGLLATCAVTTLVAAQAAALVANRIPPMWLKRITGVVMVVAAVAMLAAKLG